MRMLFLVSMAIYLCGVASVSMADDNADALKKLNGEWAVVSMEVAGTKRPEAAAKAIKLVNKDGEYTVTAESPDKGTFTVDTSKTPKTMTIKGVDGPNKGKTFLCIYELSGDEMKICYDLTGKEHPKEFKTEAGKLLMLAVYKKAK
jgi:uncharacterized protein (TIGR03067 family)